MLQWSGFLRERGGWLSLRFLIACLIISLNTVLRHQCAHRYTFFLNSQLARALFWGCWRDYQFWYSQPQRQQFCCPSMWLHYDTSICATRRELFHCWWGSVDTPLPEILFVLLKPFFVLLPVLQILHLNWSLQIHLEVWLQTKCSGSSFSLIFFYNYYYFPPTFVHHVGGFFARPRLLIRFLVLVQGRWHTEHCLIVVPPPWISECKPWEMLLTYLQLFWMLLSRILPFASVFS